MRGPTRTKVTDVSATVTVNSVFEILDFMLPTNYHAGRGTNMRNKGGHHVA